MSTDPKITRPRGRPSKNTPADRARAQICAAAVAIEFAVPELDLGRPDARGAGVDFARQVAMYLAHIQYGLNHSRIGELFSRDRSTVSYACRAVSDLLDDEVFADKVDRVSMQLHAFSTLAQTQATQ